MSRDRKALGGLIMVAGIGAALYFLMKRKAGASSSGSPVVYPNLVTDWNQRRIYNIMDGGQSGQDARDLLTYGAIFPPAPVRPPYVGPLRPTSQTTLIPPIG